MKSQTRTRLTFASTTDTGSIGLGSSTMSSPTSSRHHLRSDIDTNFIMGAPTPYNTMADSLLYADQSIPGAIHSYGPIDEDGQRASVGLRTGDTGMSYPYTISSTASNDCVPQSTRPVPAPPQVRGLSSAGDANDASTSYVSLERPVTGASERFASRFRRPRKELDRDALRLQQLGYDPVLGRDYTFWSSFFISWISIGCLQVSMNPESIVDRNPSSNPSLAPMAVTTDTDTAQGTIFAVPGTYRYGGPMMIVSARCSRYDSL